MEINPGSIIGEIVRANYKTAQLFENNNIDYCCGGNISIDEACSKAGINMDDIISKVKSVLSYKDPESEYIENLPVDRLCEYITLRHHGYVSEKIPFLQQKINKLYNVHGLNHHELYQLKKLFDAVAGNLAKHMKKEELVLFPYVKRMMRVKKRAIHQTFVSSDIFKPVHEMLEEHQAVGEQFRKISTLTNHYRVPDDGCNTYIITYKTLREFETDLHRHIHLENNILFPKAIALEKELLINS